MGIRLSRHQIKHLEETSKSDASTGPLKFDITYLTQLTRSEIVGYIDRHGEEMVSYSKRSFDISIPTPNPHTRSPARWEISDAFVVSDDRLKISNRLTRLGAFGIRDGNDTAMCAYEQCDGCITHARVFAWNGDCVARVAQALATGCPILGQDTNLRFVEPAHVSATCLASIEYMRFTIHAIVGWYLMIRHAGSSDSDLETLLQNIIDGQNSHQNNESFIMEFVSKVKHK